MEEFRISDFDDELENVDDESTGVVDAEILSFREKVFCNGVHTNVNRSFPVPREAPKVHTPQKHGYKERWKSRVKGINKQVRKNNLS